MTCALRDGTPSSSSPLVLTPDEQRALFRINVQPTRYWPLPVSNAGKPRRAVRKPE